MSAALVVVVQFLGRHWRALVLCVGTLCLGVYLGRSSVRCPASPACPTCQVCEAMAVARCPTCSSDAGVTIRWVTNPAPAVPGCPALPPVPEVTVAVSGVAGGGVAASESSTALPPPPDVPKAAPVPAQRPLPVWTVGAGAGIDFGGHLVVPVGVSVNPWGGPVGLGISVQACPGAMSQSSVAGVVQVRF